MIGRKINQQISLHDRRKLGFAEYGSTEGDSIFYFHGFPSFRFAWQLFKDDITLSELNVQILVADHPGYGLSDPWRGRKMLDWPEDVLELADKLQIERFAVLGISGGGPYAASCSNKIGERLTKVGIVSGMGPSDSPGMKDGVSWTIPGTPAIIRRLMLMLTSLGLQRDPDRFMSRSSETFSEPDKDLLEESEVAKLFIDGMREAFRTGVG
jgi:pimeloyl-ACP methyl ester carboxylesterase